MHKLCCASALCTQIRRMKLMRGKVASAAAAALACWSQAPLHARIPAALLAQQQLQPASQRGWPAACSAAWATCSHRTFASMPQADLDKEVEEINSLFVFARDEIEMAQEDSETTYFDQSVAEAKKVVDTCLQRWQSLLNQLDDQERQKLQRSMGLKMEQLKAEFKQVEQLHLED